MPNSKSVLCFLLQTRSRYAGWLWILGSRDWKPERISLFFRNGFKGVQNEKFFPKRKATVNIELSWIIHKYTTTTTTNNNNNKYTTTTVTRSFQFSHAKLRCSPGILHPYRCNLQIESTTLPSIRCTLVALQGITILKNRRCKQRGGWWVWSSHVNLWVTLPNPTTP